VTRTSKKVEIQELDSTESAIMMIVPKADQQGLKISSMATHSTVNTHHPTRVLTTFHPTLRLVYTHAKVILTLRIHPCRTSAAQVAVPLWLSLDLARAESGKLVVVMAPPSMNIV
jgi:hypothetical protein